MKVILLAPTPPPAGGIASWTVRMQKASLKNGWSVEVVDEKLIGGRNVFGNNNKIKLSIEIKRSLRIWKELHQALKNEEAVIVHSCISATTPGMLRELVCALITKLARKKFIIHYRCTLPNMVFSKLSVQLFKLLTNVSDLAFVLNTSSVEFVNKYSNTLVELIPNFIEENQIIREGTKKISEKIQRVLYVGGVIESKGCLDIIKVAEKFPEMQFRLVGNPEKKISELQKPPNLILVGEKNKLEVKKELEEADIFMFVSYYQGEGFSNALAEAMSNGLPCLVSDWAANYDMIEEEGGIVVDTKDIDSMINSLRVLSKDRERRQKQSDWNIKKVRKYYIDKIVTNMYVDAYERITKK